MLWPLPPLYTAWRCLTQRLTGSWPGLTGRRLRALAHRAENCGGSDVPTHLQETLCG